MNDAAATVGVALLIAACLAALPRLVARGPRVWGGAWLLAGLLTLLLGLARRYEWLDALAPFSVLTAGRREFVLYAPAIVLLLGLPAIQVPRRATRGACAGLAAAALWTVSISPFLEPLLQATPVSYVDRDGVCLQADSYNCGPASAVTVLRQMGFDADLPMVSRAAHTSAAIGTPTDLLCGALEQLYPVHARTVYPSTPDELPPGRSLVVLKLGLFVDHYVALLALSPTSATLGDPLSGRLTLPRAELQQRWRGAAVVVEPRT